MQKSGDSPRIKKLKEGARKISIQEGAIATVQSGFGDSYITPYAIALNASNAEIGFLASIPGLLGPISQWFSSRLIEKSSRKKIVLFALLLQGLMWLPIILLSYLFYKGIFTGTLPVLLIVFFSVYIVFGNIAGPAWFSWMGDIVDEKNRGKYFSKRNRIAGIVSLLCMLIAAYSLDFFKRHSIVLVGFSILFFLAMSARLISRLMFKKQYEPRIKLEKGYYFTFWQFLKKAPSNNFGKFAIFRSFMSFATSIAGPFFAVYMLRNLNFSYITYVFVALSPTVFSLLIMPLWGKFSDKYGNYKTIKITSFLIPLLPLLWIVSGSPFYLFFVPEMISGIAWAGFNLASGNFIYDSVTPQKRGVCVAYYNLLHGMGVFLGASLGAILVKYISTSPIIWVFVISAIVRALVSFIGISKIKEVREVEKFDGNRAFKNLVIKTMRYPAEGVHELFALKKLKKAVLNI